MAFNVAAVGGVGVAVGGDGAGLELNEGFLIGGGNEYFSVVGGLTAHQRLMLFGPGGFEANFEVDRFELNLCPIGMFKNEKSKTVHLGVCLSGDFYKAGQGNLSPQIGDGPWRSDLSLKVLVGIRLFPGADLNIVIQGPEMLGTKAVFDEVDRLRAEGLEVDRHSPFPTMFKIVTNVVIWK